MIVYTALMAGALYDLHTGVPSMGSAVSKKTGGLKTAFVRAGDSGAQWVAEGIAVAALFSCGSIGFMLLDAVEHSKRDPRLRMLALVAGGVLAGGCYNICMVFLRVKLPRYLLADEG